MSDASIHCPYCFESFPIELYPQDGETQDLIYDCEVCCSPIDIRARWVEDSESFSIQARRSSGHE